MNKFKSIVSIVLVISMLTGVLAICAACGGTGDGYVEVEGKTNLRVATYDGGLGSQWLDEAARAFEAQYAETSFEEGKKGVVVHVEKCSGGDMMETQNLDKDVYFTEVVDYYKYVNLGKVADISSAVTGDLGDFGESGKTIQDKLDNSFVNFLTAKDGKYYGLPFYEGYMGLVYDRDLFAAKGYFIDPDGNWTGDEDNLSVGADGVAGTYDDGMPITYSDMLKLIQKMQNDNITPFIYGSECAPYFIKLLANYWADYEGKTKMEMNWNLTGTFDIITGFKGTTPSLGEYTLDQNNIAASVKNLQKQPGKYYALKWMDEVFCSSETNFTTQRYLVAQESFIGASMSGAKNVYGMLVDGVWWENEATISGAFDNIAAEDINYNPADGSYKSTRRFAFMPLPVEDSKYAADQAAGITRKQTLFSGNDAFCFVSANTSGAKLELAKLFLQFTHTDKMLSAFTATTGIPRAFNYTVAESDVDKMTYFGKYMMDMKNASDVVYPYSGHEYYLKSSATFSLNKWGWSSKIGGGIQSNPFLILKGDTDAKTYFNGLVNAY